MSRSPASIRRAGRILAFAAAAVTPLALLAVPAAAAPPPGVPAATPDSVPGAWIVTLEPDALAQRVADEHARQHGARVDHVYRHALNGYAARMPDQKAALVAQDPRVASVERDQVVTIAAQTTPTGIDRIDAEPTTTSDGGGTPTDVDVAVIDTGIAAHADLDIEGGINCVKGEGEDPSSYGDGNGHGTHVAGTIGARDDAWGVVGVAPGARLWAVRVLNDQGSGTRTDIMCGIEWVTGHDLNRDGKPDIEVANMSIGGSGTEPSQPGCDTGDAYHDAICRSVGAGVTYVVAAGNARANAATTVPAAYDEVITVSALADFNGLPGGGARWTCRRDGDDTFADFSNYGSDVDLIAPGVCINSTWRGGGYHTISGTSMAAPHVAGAAALHKVKNPAATPDQVKGALLHAATGIWDNRDDRDKVKEPLLKVTGL